MMKNTRNSYVQPELISLDAFETGRAIPDVINNRIYLTTNAYKISKTPEFQRLRNIRQLGSVSFIYPCANHTRLEHCYGVYHLAGQLANRIRVLQPELDVTNTDLETVQLAGLLHDIGHGAFSHAFESVAIKVTGDTHFTHEHQSGVITDYLLNKNGIELSEDMEKGIKRYIMGDAVCESKRFLADIVANKRNSVDVDKLDYLQRDSRSVGLGLGFETPAIIGSTIANRSGIHFHTSTVDALMELFHARCRMFRDIYASQSSVAVDLMLRDALIYSSEFYNLKEKIPDPECYCQLDDGILSNIMNDACLIRRKMKGVKEEEEGFFECDGHSPRSIQGLMKADKLVRKLLGGKYYTFLRACRLLGKGGHRETWLHTASTEDIEDAMVRYGAIENSFCVDINKFTIGKTGRCGPLTGILFVDSKDDTPREVHPSRFSLTYPSQQEEIYIRVYSRSNEPKKVMAANNAFDKILEETGADLPILDGHYRFIERKRVPSLYPNSFEDIPSMNTIDICQSLPNIKQNNPNSALGNVSSSLDATEIPSQIARDYFGWSEEK